MLATSGGKLLVLSRLVFRKGVAIAWGARIASQVMLPVPPFNLH
jgi:hypothetical protein